MENTHNNQVNNQQFFPIVRFRPLILSFIATVKLTVTVETIEKGMRRFRIIPIFDGLFNLINLLGGLSI